MIRWPFRRTRPGNPDPERFLSQLARAHPGKSRYADLDRYRDFRALFLETERGRRVLYELLSWGHVFRASAPMAQFDPHKTLFHDGERSIALKIMATMNAEPMERPAKINAKEP